MLLPLGLWADWHLNILRGWGFLHKGIQPAPLLLLQNIAGITGQKQARVCLPPIKKAPLPDIPAEGLNFFSKASLLRHKGVHGHKRVHVRGRKMAHGAVGIRPGLYGHLKLKRIGGQRLGPQVGGCSLGAMHKVAGFFHVAALQGLSHL